MFYVYVLQSLADSGLYIGYTANLRLRLAQHQRGDSQATKSRRPWRLIYYEAYIDQDDALGRERFLKSGTGRSFLRKQCVHYFRVYGCADAAGRAAGCSDATASRMARHASSPLHSNGKFRDSDAGD